MKFLTQLATLAIALSIQAQQIDGINNTVSSAQTSLDTNLPTGSPATPTNGSSNANSSSDSSSSAATSNTSSGSQISSSIKYTYVASVNTKLNMKLSTQLTTLIIAFIAQGQQNSITEPNNLAITTISNDLSNTQVQTTVTLENGKPNQSLPTGNPTTINNLGINTVNTSKEGS
ncbi:hypothetical protein CONCODRAFT_12677, partial [Conidiobolus coronatus NRRL 28638]